ncbi:MaoC family dehydratase [Tistrella bauzanensis]|uniref:MaoC family dehydratase n=1 Tax=Tistrella TaxID=171436 RepID=UPI0031F695C7
MPADTVPAGTASAASGLPVTDLYFEDFAPGQTFNTPSRHVTEDEVIAFARQFDDQPFHVDREAAAASIYGGIIASGFHTLSLGFKLVLEARIVSGSSMGSPGLDEIRWLKPMRPGDTVRLVLEVTEVIPSRSKPDRGIVKLLYTTFNQKDEAICTMRGMWMLRRRTVMA